MPRLKFLLTACLSITAIILIASVTGHSTSAQSAPSAAPAPAASGTAAAAAPRITYSSAHVEGPYIAMTFDDGPSAANTPRLLDLLAKLHIKATFFLIGQNVVANPQIAKRIHDEGHEIGNHTWTHPVLATLPDDKVRSELQMTDDAIFKAVGIHPTLMRPPYGALAIAQRKWINKEFGYKIILWDVDPNDWKVLKGETPAERTARVESVILNGDKEEHAARSGSIILSHDIHSTTVDAMEDTLTKLQAKGFKFVTVSELIAMDKPVPPKPAGATPPATAGTQAVSGTTAPAQ